MTHEAHLAKAREAAYKKYDGDRIVSDITGEEESHDDWGYAETARQGFIAGVEWSLENFFSQDELMWLLRVARMVKHETEHPTAVDKLKALRNG